LNHAIQKQRKQQLAKKASYLRYKDDYLSRQKERKNAARDYINSIKKRSKCSKCPIDNYVVLDFHHRDPKMKEISACDMVTNKYSIARIDAELAKCDIVCANCHRIIHYELGQGK
jgi:hypothetical protein